MFGLHPNYLAYYSPLVGGIDYGMNVIEPKWPVAYDKIAKTFNEMENPEDIKVAIANYDNLVPFADFKVMNIKHATERDSADYFVLPEYSKDRNEFYKSNYRLEELKKKNIKVAGVIYYRVYKVHLNKD